jgi:hypothetical protein
MSTPLSPNTIGNCNYILERGREVVQSPISTSLFLQINLLIPTKTCFKIPGNKKSQSWPNPASESQCRCLGNVVSSLPEEGRYKKLNFKIEN